MHSIDPAKNDYVNCWFVDLFSFTFKMKNHFWFYSCVYFEIDFYSVKNCFLLKKKTNNESPNAIRTSCVIFFKRKKNHIQTTQIINWLTIIVINQYSLFFFTFTVYIYAYVWIAVVCFQTNTILLFIIIFSSHLFHLDLWFFLIHFQVKSVCKCLCERVTIYACVCASFYSEFSRLYNFVCSCMHTILNTTSSSSSLPSSSPQKCLTKRIYYTDDTQIYAHTPLRDYMCVMHVNIQCFHVISKQIASIM